jgi:hypothetical protein
MATSLATP